ncbi:pentapeptide repeat-containing protein [Candidatus Dependentiae bacterium]|nr:pentapeptide repeat-containing protein [Candidatus Dependentiae bacterium]
MSILWILRILSIFLWLPYCCAYNPDHLAKVREQLVNNAGQRACFFKDLDLSFANLSDLDFSYAVFHRVNFTGANLSKSVFRRCFFYGVDFTQAVMIEANVERAQFRNIIAAFTNFSNANMKKAIFDSANFYKARFVYVTAQESKWCYVYFNKANFQFSDFTQACFYCINIKNADFSASMFDKVSIEKVYGVMRSNDGYPYNILPEAHVKDICVKEWSHEHNIKEDFGMKTSWEHQEIMRDLSDISYDTGYTAEGSPFPLLKEGEETQKGK